MSVQNMEDLLHFQEDEPPQLRELRERRRKEHSLAGRFGLLGKKAHRFSYPGNATGSKAPHPNR